MAETKYGKDVVPAPISVHTEHGPLEPNLGFDAVPHGINSGFAMVPIVRPIVLEDKPHKRDFPQFLFFIGSDPNNIGDLGAEIEMYLGEEGEKHVITTPTMLIITPGLVHCPLNYKRVDRPVYHLDIYFAEKYVRL